MHAGKQIINKTLDPVFGSCLVALCAATSPSLAQAQNLDAGYVMNKMTAEQRVSYVNGIVDGLAYARFLRDRPDDTGYLCIINWFQTDAAKKWELARKWLKRHPEKPASVLIYLMTKRNCGE